jgi:hypothetical protein
MLSCLSGLFLNFQLIFLLEYQVLSFPEVFPRSLPASLQWSLVVVVHVHIVICLLTRSMLSGASIQNQNKVSKQREMIVVCARKRMVWGSALGITVKGPPDSSDVVGRCENNDICFISN